MLATPRLEPKQLISQLQLQVGRARIPRILLGTSPFIGGGQFGSRATLYYDYFYRHPENIVKIILAAVDMGVTGVQALPFPPIFGALKAVQRELRQELTVVGTVGPDDPLSDIRKLQRFHTVAMLVHGEMTNGRELRRISELLNQIRAANCLAGLAMHKPLSTLSWLLKTELDVDLIMLPFNRLGVFMDSTAAETAEAIRRVGKPVVGKKVLAAGYLSPIDALPYIAKLGCIQVVALGVASEKEAKETFAAAATAFSGAFSV